MTPEAAPDDPAARFRERSRGVRRLRVALPAAMAALVVAVVGWIAVNGFLADRRTLGAAAGGLHMTNPRFFGRDESGRAFTIQAAEAVRDAGVADRVSLQGPTLALDHGGARPTTVRAKTGTYSETARRLVLNGGVGLDDGEGAHLESPTAVIDTRTGDVEGTGGVVGSSPLGRFQASSYLVKGKGAEVVFSGGVRAHLENKPKADTP